MVTHYLVSVVDLHCAIREVYFCDNIDYEADVLVLSSPTRLSSHFVSLKDISALISCYSVLDRSSKDLEFMIKDCFVLEIKE